MDQQSLIPEIAVTGTILKPNNGNGRPKGARNVKNAWLQKIAMQRAPELVDTVVTAALQGDMIAMKLVLDRIWPRPRTAAVSLGLQQTQTAGDLREAMHDVLARVNEGSLTADVGAAVVQMMRDMIAAHSIQTILPAGPMSQTQDIDAREMLAEKLTRLLEARQREADDEAEADDDRL